MGTWLILKFTFFLNHIRINKRSMDTNLACPHIHLWNIGGLREDCRLIKLAIAWRERGVKPGKYSCDAYKGTSASFEIDILPKDS
jgi:hypothetical protein